LGLNKKIITVTFLLILSCIALIAPLGNAQNTNLGVSILQLTPSGGSATVGTQINLIGTIYQSNGTYQVVFNNVIVVASGQAEGYYVDTNFTVPEIAAGTYSLKLRDVLYNLNSSQTTSQITSFTVNTGYSISSSTASIQEGGSVTLTASVTGASIGTSYYANVKVTLPNSGTFYTKTLFLGTANSRGTASLTTAFPDASFSPVGSTTNYAGAYTYSFNDTTASNTFNVNILDQTSYHRGQTVAIRAIGYEANQAASITVTSVKTGGLVDTIQTTASSDGVITASYTVPQTADLSDFTIKINPTGKQKTIADSQTFTVAGYSVTVQTVNLAGDIVPGISVQALDPLTNTASNATTDSSGNANFKFEKGTIALTAFWNGVNVGTQNITVSGDGTFQLACKLTNLIITVKNSAGTPIPFVNLNIQYNYQATGTQTGSATGQTGPTGSYILPSALAGASYLVDASIYNQIFNAGNNTFSNLPNQATVDVTIICPSETVSFNVVGGNQAPIAGARVELVETSNGLFYSTATDSNGAASAQVTFGTYRIRVYKDNAQIYETTMQIFKATQKTLVANLYGISVQVKVVDALGGAISNAAITLNGPQTLTGTTKGDGTVTFDNLVGGNMQVIAQANGNPEAYQALTINVEQSTTVTVKMDKFIALGSTLIPASLLLTIIIILLAVVILVVVEVIRRRRVKA
jgi:hypothetical protein